MDHAELERFIVEAKSNTYVGGGGRTSPSRLGSHDLAYERGDWRYRDSYFGGWDFLGQEVVWLREEAVWAMNYYGWINDRAQISAETAGAVITTALNQLYRQGRFLGGFTAEVSGFRYVDESSGDVQHFEGREHIVPAAGGEPAYSLIYHGGMVRAS